MERNKKKLGLIIGISIALVTILVTTLCFVLGNGKEEHTHSWYEKERIEATCVEEGRITYGCKSCEEIKLDIIHALGHEEVIDEGYEATCEEDGLTDGKHCGRCDEILLAQEVIYFLGHEYGEWEIINNATCEEDGLERLYCSVCDHYSERTIESTGHDYLSEVTKPTCHSDGYTTHTCSKCNDVFVNDYKDKLEHAFNNELERVEATCEEDGYVKYVCNGCNETIIETLPMLSHNILYPTDFVDATCTEDGFKQGYCEHCNEFIYIKISATGHSEEYTVHTGEYCNSIEIGDVYCQYCNEFLYSYGHKYEEEITKSTCEEDGIKVSTCIQCGKTNSETLPALGHYMSDWKVTTNPTCESEGVKTRYCQKCNSYEENEAISMLDHDYQCVEQDSGVLYDCKNCDHSYFIKGYQFHTITFVTNSDEEIDPIVVVTNESIELPIPTKDGYDFLGWYSDEDYLVLYDDSSTYTSNVTLYAEWIPTYLEESVDSNNLLLNVATNYSFDIISNVYLDEYNLDNFVCVTDNYESVQNIYIKSVANNVYTISCDDYVNGMTYSVKITDQVSFKDTEEKEIWFMIEDTQHFDVSYKSDVVLIHELDVYNITEDNDNIYLYTEKDLLNVDNKVVIYAEDIYDISAMLVVLSESYENSLYVYQVDFADENDIFESYNLYTSAPLDVSNIEFDGELEEELVETFKESELYSQLTYAARSFASSYKTNKYEYRFSGFYIKPSYHSEGTKVFVQLAIAVKFNRVQKGTEKVVGKLNIALQVTNKIGLDINASAQNINNFTFIIGIDNNIKVDIFVSDANDDSLVELNYFKNQFVHAKKEGKFQELSATDASKSKETRIASLPIYYCGFRFAIDISNVFSFETVGELGIATENSTSIKVGIRRTSKDGFKFIKSYQSYSKFSLHFLGKLKLSDAIKLKISTTFLGVAEVYASVSAGPYFEAAGMFSLTITSVDKPHYSAGGYIQMGVEVNADIGVKIEQRIKFKLFRIKVDRMVTILNKRWEIFSWKYPFFTLGKTEADLYFTNFHDIIDGKYYCDSSLDLNDFVDKEVVIQDLENMEKYTKNVSGVFKLDEEYKGVTLTEDGILKVYMEDFEDLQINVRLYHNNIYKIITLRLDYAHSNLVINESSATCTSGGFSEYNCSGCGASEYKYSEALGHDYTSIVTKPTCESAGYTTWICRRCSDSYVNNQRPPLGHSYSDTYSYDNTHHWYEATCSHKDEVSGYEEHQLVDGYCQKCAYYEENIIEELEYELSNDGTYYSVVGIGTVTDTDIIIPETYNGLPVKEIGECAFADCEFETISLPNGITTISTSLFEGCLYLKEVIIPNSVTRIEEKAFKFCESLNNVVLSENLTFIGNNAFQDCYSLEQIIIPNSVTTIEEGAFIYCKSLEKVEIKGNITSIKAHTFNWCNLIEITIPHSVEYIGEYAFYNNPLTNIYYTGTEKQWNEIEISSNNESLTNAIIHFNEDEVAGALEYELSSDGTYYSVVGIGTVTDTDIIIPETYNGLPVKEIGDEAFYETHITSIVIPNSVNFIGINAFDSCYALNSITLPNGLEVIEECLFAGCESLKNITIPNSVKLINEEAFNGCSSLESIIIPNGVEIIEDNAFDGCISLKGITIPESVVSIGMGAFNDCGSLEFLKVDRNNDYYDSRNNCNAIIETSTNTLVFGCVNTIIPADVLIVGDASFSRCENLTSIVIPEGVTIIGEEAFYGCYSLKSITIPISVKTINTAALGFSSIENIYYQGTEQQWNQISIGGWNSFVDVKIHFNDNPPEEIISLEYELSSDGTYYSVVGIGTITDANVVIPETYNGLPVTSIGNDAFFKCNTLESIVIPNSINNIGQYAFYGCGLLTSIEIPESVESIGVGAFMECGSLESVIVDSNNNYYDSRDNCNALIETSTNALITGSNNTVIPNTIKSISGYAFCGCSSLNNIEIPRSVTYIGDWAFAKCASLEKIEIPDSVKEVGSRAFENCVSLASITIPNSVLSLGESAFYGCSSLTDVYFLGTEEQWNNSIWMFCVDQGHFANATIYFMQETHKHEWVNGVITKNPSCSETGEMTYSCTGCDEKLVEEMEMLDHPFSGEYSYNDTHHWYAATCEHNDLTLEYEEHTLVDGYCQKCAYYGEMVEYVDGMELKLSADGTSYHITGYLESISSDIVIPSTYNGLPITNIEANAFLGCEKLTSIIIPSSVTNIGMSAFSDCTSLSKVSIASGITVIEILTFSGCVSLETISIPQSVTTIGVRAFYYCTALNNLEILNGVKYVHSSAFEGCSSLESIIIPNAIEILSGAFADCISLNTVGVTNTLRYLGDHAFYNCYKLEYIINDFGQTIAKIPPGVTIIYDGTFYNCQSLKTVEFLGQVTKIGKNAFYNCSSLSDIYYYGTKSQWNSIEIYSGNNDLLYANIHCQ